MAAEAWQTRLFKKSLMKKEKVRLIAARIDFREKVIFDLGCSQGAVSFELCRKGGRWLHADLNLRVLESARDLLNRKVVQVNPCLLPLKGNSCDVVLTLDILEHVTEDQKVLAEAGRILKPGGELVISTPISGRFFILNALKRRLGLKPESYGHCREGYSLAQLETMLAKADFEVVEKKTYAKFFSELFEVLLNAAYIRKNRANRPESRSGLISPLSEGEMSGHRLLWKMYGLFVYPLIFLITLLDRLLFFKTGYATLVLGRKK